MSVKTQIHRQHSGKHSAAGTKGPLMAFEEKKSVMFWFFACFTSLFLLFAPFKRGLFNGGTDFDGANHSAILWAAIAMIGLSIHLFMQWKLQTRLDVLHLLVWLLPLSYYISTFVAASHYRAINSFYIYVTYAVFFVIGVYFAKSKLGAGTLQWAILGSSAVIILFGYMNWFGDGSLWGIFKWNHSTGVVSRVYEDAVQVDSNGPRMASVFQYANSYASYLIAMLLSFVFIIISSRKWVSIAIGAALTIPALIALFLTLSRGGLVIMAVMFFVVLPFLTLHRQIMYIINFVLALIIAIMVLNPLTDRGLALQKQFSASDNFKAWGILIAASVIFAGIAYVLQRYVAPKVESGCSRLSGKSWSRAALPVIGLIVGGIGLYLIMADTGFVNILPDNIRTRVENINFNQHSVLERGTFYKDAMKLFRDYPLFGAGGGAWAELYEKYQNNPYTSRQAHNFFLQYLVEVGAFGFIWFGVFLLAILYNYLKSYIKQSKTRNESQFIFFITAVSLLVHSAIDFDLSFIYLGLILFLCLGAMIAGVELPALSFQSRLTNVRWLRPAYPVVLLLLAFVVLFASARYVQADSGFKNARMAVQSQRPFNEIMNTLNGAIQKSGNPDFSTFRIELLQAAYKQTNDLKYLQQAEQMIPQIKKSEPFNRKLLVLEYSIAMSQNQFEKAEEIVNKGLSHFPWDIQIYEYAINVYLQLGIDAKSKQDSAGAAKHWEQAHTVYNRILSKMKDLESLPKEQGQGREFDVTQGVAATFGQVYYYQGDYAQAEAMLKQGLPTMLNEENARTVARTYLATLKKLNKNDDALYSALIDQDPKEAERIEQLLK